MNSMRAPVICIVLLLMVAGFSACHIFHKHKAKGTAEPMYIRAQLRGKDLNYRYNVTGDYDTVKRKIVLKANDTTLAESKMWSVQFLLAGRLDTMQMPAVFSAVRDSKNHQTQFAQLIHDENSPDGRLLDNFTYRSWSDLQIIILSKTGDVLRGTFQGMIFNMNKKLRVTNGSFCVKIRRH